MAGADNLCSKINNDISKQLNQLRSLKSQLQKYKNQLASLLDGFLPSDFDIPQVPTDFNLGLGDCAAINPKIAKSTLLKTYNPFDGMDFPEVDMNNKIGSMNKLFSGVGMLDKLKDINTNLSCLAYQCNINISSIGDEVSGLLDELDVDEVTGSLDIKKVFQNASVPDVGSLVRKMADMDGLKSAAKNKIKNLF